MFEGGSLIWGQRECWIFGGFSGEQSLMRSQTDDLHLKARFKNCRGRKRFTDFIHTFQHLKKIISSVWELKVRDIYSGCRFWSVLRNISLFVTLSLTSFHRVCSSKFREDQQTQKPWRFQSRVHLQVRVRLRSERRAEGPAWGLSLAQRAEAKFASHPFKIKALQIKQNSEVTVRTDFFKSF